MDFTTDELIEVLRAFRCGEPFPDTRDHTVWQSAYDKVVIELTRRGINVAAID